MRWRAAVADGFARHDDVEVVVDAALTGRTNAAAGTAAGDHERVDALGYEHVQQVRAEEGRCPRLLDQWLVRLAAELRCEGHAFRVVEHRVQVRELQRHDAADLGGRAVRHSGEVDRQPRIAGDHEQALNAREHTGQIRPEPLTRVDPRSGHVDHQQRRTCAPAHAAGETCVVVLLSDCGGVEATRHRRTPLRRQQLRFCASPLIGRSAQRRLACAVRCA